MTRSADAAILLLPPLWLGMVLAISFLEAPLKFRAPGVTLPLGLGIGRIVFRALNAAETVLAMTVIGACLVGNPDGAQWVLAAGAAFVLAVQLVIVRPPLTARSDRVLAGEDAPRSRMHFVYIGFEVAKVGLLIALAVVSAAHVV